MKIEQREGLIPRPESFLPVEAVIDVEGLMPATMEKVLKLTWRGNQPEFQVEEEREIPDNLDDRLPRVAEEIEKRPWILQLIQDVHDGKKSAIFKVSLGALVVFAALGSGFEFGIRGGRDIRELHSRLRALRGSNSV